MGIELSTPPERHLFKVFKNLWVGAPQNCGKHTYVESATVSLTALEFSLSKASEHICVIVPPCLLKLPQSACLHHLTRLSVCRWAAVPSQTGMWSYTKYCGRKKEHLLLFAMTREGIPTPQWGHALSHGVNFHWLSFIICWRKKELGLDTQVGGNIDLDQNCQH